MNREQYQVVLFLRITYHVSRITHRISHFIRRHRRIFIVQGCLLIVSTGVWTSRSARVKRLTALARSYMDVSRHDVTIQVAPGIQHLQIKQGVLINILGLAPDTGIGTESIISLARRHNALVAINGGYFEMAATFRGESVGALKIGGEWISEPEQRRAAIGLSMISGRVEAIIDRIELEIELVLQGDETLAIDGFNRARIENELILYRPIFHAVTLTDLDGVEVLVRDNHVVDIRDGQGSSRIPDDGYVLSANASKRDWLVAHLSVGDKICIRETVIPQHIEIQKQWQAVEHIISGGPLLLRGGVPTSSEDHHDAEGFNRIFRN